MNIKKFIKKLIPPFLIQIYHFKLALLGAIVFWFPSREVTVIGVTGTSGKSTTVDFISKILEEAGNKVASISTARFKMGQKEWKNSLKMSMPGRFAIQKFLRQAVSENCKYLVLEVTSEGIKQFRHQFIGFNTVVFTNLSPEHIESHGGFENYRNEKLKLFNNRHNIHVVNIDDEQARYFLLKSGKENFGFSTKIHKEINGLNLVYGQILPGNEKGLHFKVKDTEFSLALRGDFNVYNALAAISVALAQKVSLDVCKKALEKVVEVAGRMEVVNESPLVIVDYAHTPNQLEAVYQSLKGKNLVCVFGSCGGGRDVWKRPVMGKIAMQYCKEIIITDEDPYDEDPLEIMEQVAEGIDPEVKRYKIVVDRKEAILQAIEVAGNDDTVIITGKGSEPLMCLKDGKKIPWSDKQIVLDAIKK
jgi:UDP-N-acetylmuramoyl-L-alanyl-D-glutamate--2,6-diaminopimelate ligase